MLQIFRKIFEKVVNKQLHTYFEQNHILYEHQYGFRKQKCTVQALLNHIQFMYDSIDSGNIVIKSEFLDFKKALQTVNDKIVSSKFDFTRLTSPRVSASLCYPKKNRVMDVFVREQ